MGNILLIAEVLPLVAVPLVYVVGTKSSRAASIFLALIVAADLALFALTVPMILSGAYSIPAEKYIYPESYVWFPLFGQDIQFTLFVDGISAPIVMVTLVLVFAAAIYSPRYFGPTRPTDGGYYALLTLLTGGLVGVFITSNLLFFYFNWEFMLIPAYFIIARLGGKNSKKAAFKFFIFTHAGAVFVLLGIGTLYWVTKTLDLFTAQGLFLAPSPQLKLLLQNSPDIFRWMLIAFTGGFAVKMAVFPLHGWLPDTYAESPAPMTAILSGVITSAGVYAILRISLETIFPAVQGSTWGTDFMHGLAIFGIATALFGSFIALAQTDIKRLIAYSSISQMGYLLFGLSLFQMQMGTSVLGPYIILTIQVAMIGTVLHIINHAVSKGLLFLTAGAIVTQTGTDDTSEMGGLAGQMPTTATMTTTAALSIGGVPPLACFASELLIFIGAFQVINLDSFYIVPTIIMLVVTILSLAYVLRYIARVVFGTPKSDKVHDVPFSMKFALVLLGIFVLVLGIWPTYVISFIGTAFGLPPLTFP